MRKLPNRAEALETMGIGIEYHHHEVAPSQHEIDMRYKPALQMADATLTYRLIVGFVYNAAMGGWLLFRVSQLQKRRALERGPRACNTEHPLRKAGG